VISTLNYLAVVVFHSGIIHKKLYDVDLIVHTDTFHGYIEAHLTNANGKCELPNKWTH
jgi:hypothetical protein